MEFDGDLVIINLTFINNSASDRYALYACYYCHHDCSNITKSYSGIVHTVGHGSTVKIYDSKFLQNEGDIIFGENLNMIITHTRFMKVVVYSGVCGVIIKFCITDSNLTVSHM